MKPRVERFLDMIEERGWEGRIVPIGHLADLQEAICDRYEQGLIDEALYREQLGFFSFDPPADLPDARSIVIVAGAVTNDRFLLHAERCLTYHNEAANDFPDWIDPSWHHCLIGCLRCQTACPENRTVLEWFEDRAEFSEQETMLFIRRVPLDRLPAETAVKLKSLEINEDYRLLCRNLSMIIGRESCAR